MGLLDLFGLENKVALVTGAARGLGQGIAVGLAEAGADLWLIDRIDCAETARLVRERGRKVKTEIRDLSVMNEKVAEEMISKGIEEWGRLNILVNNAGIIRRAPSLEFSSKDWQQVLDINLNTVFYISQAVARHFIQQKIPGKIINLCSMLSFQGGLMVPSYTASKSAILGLTKAFANEWAGMGVNVNAIAPGYLVSEVTAGIRTDPERNKAVLDRIPAGRWGKPEDIKGAVVFLASNAANYIHGSVIPIDGGWLAR